MLNSFQLKCLALITMIIDHTANALNYCIPTKVYILMRGIGRLAFPIYAFLLVEGFMHTRNRNKYVSRLLLFAIISELPYDTLFGCNFTFLPGDLPLPIAFDWSDQNIFFTLALGFVALMFLEFYHGNRIASITIMIAFGTFAEIINCNYGAYGVGTIILFYLLRKYGLGNTNPILLLICLLPLSFCAYPSFEELPCLFSVIPLALYNGEKGKGMKYFFYLIYPAHLLILLFISNHMYLILPYFQ